MSDIHSVGYIKINDINLKVTIMKRIIMLVTVVLFITTPIMAQSETGGVADNPTFQTSAYAKFLTKAGQYTEHQVGGAVIMKLISPATLGGYTLRAEKITDMVHNHSKQAISMIPNSSTGLGKLVSQTTGIGGGAKSYYLDFEEIPKVVAAIAKMQEHSKTTPALYTRYSYTCIGGFSFSITFLQIGKKAFWVGQVAEAGTMPVAEFMAEMTTALNTIKEEFKKFK